MNSWCLLVCRVPVSKAFSTYARWHDLQLISYHRAGHMSKLLSCALNHWTRQDLTRIDCDWVFSWIQVPVAQLPSCPTAQLPNCPVSHCPVTLGLLQLVNNYQRQSKLDWSLQESQQHQALQQERDRIKISWAGSELRETDICLERVSVRERGQPDG